MIANVHTYTTSTSAQSIIKAKSALVAVSSSGYIGYALYKLDGAANSTQTFLTSAACLQQMDCFFIIYASLMFEQAAVLARGCSCVLATGTFPHDHTHRSALAATFGDLAADAGATFVSRVH